MDIWDLSKWKEHNTARYVLVSIGVFSKRIFTAAMPTKTQESVLKALEGMFEMGLKFKVLMTDNDSSFLGAKTQHVLKEHDVVHILSRANGGHAYIAERA